MSLPRNELQEIIENKENDEKEPKQENKEPSETLPEKTEEETSQTEEALEECRISFRYQGKEFAYQEIKSGEKAERPLLQPTESGHWDFDFEEEITEDIVIDWIAAE